MRTLFVRLARRAGLWETALAVRRQFHLWRTRRRSARDRARLRRRLGELPPGHRFVVQDAHTWVALGRDRVRSSQLRAANLAQLADLLTAHGIEFFVVPTGSTFRTAIGVCARDWHSAVRAVAAADLGTNWYALPSTERRAPQPLRSADRRRWTKRARSAVTIETFSVLSSESGDGVLGRHYRCDLQSWDTAPDDTDVLVPPVANHVVGPMSRQRAISGSTNVGDRSLTTAPEFEWSFAALTCPFPIDVVYTWVDGDDPEWRAKRDRVARRTTGTTGDGSTPERYLSFDELRYSLRSVWEHVPYVRHIYLVTDGQRPSWLDPAHPRITLVDHADIFEDASALPTFNSHAIESQLHHIDGLSDHYLYVNDDVFFGRLSDWSTYFHRSGTSYFFPSKALFPVLDLDDDASSVDHAGQNLQRLLVEETGWVPRTKIKHTPHPQQRELLLELERRFGDAYRRTMRSRFRSADDVSFAAALHHRYGEAIGRASPGQIRYEYLSLAADNIVDHLERLVDAPYDTLCINDASLTSDERGRVRPLVESSLQRRFPYPAPWEIDQPAGRAAIDAAADAHRSGGDVAAVLTRPR